MRLANVGRAVKFPEQWLVEVCWRVGMLMHVFMRIDRCCVSWDLVVWGVVFLAVRR